MTHGSAPRPSFICVKFPKVSNTEHSVGVPTWYRVPSPHGPRHSSVTESAACSRLIGSATMSYYRVYIVGQDGHFIDAINLNCADDGAAIESAKQLVDGRDIELWQEAAW
jgi:hypothetical protein